MNDKLDQALEALKTYDWGQDIRPSNLLDEVIVETYGDDDARKELVTKLAEVLTTDVSYDAKDLVCRKLRSVGTAECVPTLAGLLLDEKMSHMARYALERIPAPEAAKALQDALSKAKGEVKIGIIASLGQRGVTEATGEIGKLLGDGDAAIAAAAAKALGDLCTPEAAKALASGKPSTAVTDASFACAEALLADGKKAEALMIYKKYIGADQPKQVKLAATRGMLACAGK